MTFASLTSFGELLGLVLDLLRHLVGAVADRLGADLVHALAELGRLDDLHHLGVQPGHDVLRRGRRREHAEPGADVEALEPASSRVGTSGSADERLAVVTASARSLPLLMCCSTGVTVSNDIVIWPPSRSVASGPLPLYGTCTQFRAGEVLELRADQVLRRAVAVGAVGELARLRLEQRDQLGHVLGRRAGVDRPARSGTSAIVVIGAKSFWKS